MLHNFIAYYRKLSMSIKLFDQCLCMLPTSHADVVKRQAHDFCRFIAGAMKRVMRLYKCITSVDVSDLHLRRSIHSEHLR